MDTKNIPLAFHNDRVFALAKTEFSYPDFCAFVGNES